MMDTPPTHMRFLGVAAYEIVFSDGRRVLLDPFLSGNPSSPVSADDFERVDLIIVTHAARDHLGDTDVLARRTGAPVVCGGEVKAYLTAKGVPASQIRVSAWGMRLLVAGVDIQTVECRHCSHVTMPDGSHVSGIPLAFVPTLDNDIRLYHPGDTSLFMDMKLQGELYRPTIGSLGIANPEAGISPPTPGTKLSTDLSPREGVMAAQWLGLKTVLPCHYTDPANRLVGEFIAEMEKAEARGEAVPQALILSPGEWIEIKADGSVRRLAQ